jgi:hypothetical protein
MSDTSRHAFMVVATSAPELSVARLALAVAAQDGRAIAFIE